MRHFLNQASFLGICSFLLLACNTEYNTIGVDLIASEQFTNQTQEFPVYVSVDSLSEIQSNQVAVAHFGKYTFPHFGRSSASITSQLAISFNPTFGLYSQEKEEEGDEDNIAIIPENEQVTEVYLELPFLYNQEDADGDGLVDAFDVDPTSTDSDSDGDGVTDLEEFQANTNPLDEDSDGDGILDGEDDENEGYNAGDNVYEIDNIYGNTANSIALKVVELTHYFSLLDPDNNFETASIYYSGRDYYEEGYLGRTLFDDTYALDLEEQLFYYEEDDEETTEIDETTQVESRLTPRLRVPLDPTFFQEKLIDQEGQDPLANQNNFNNFVKAIHVRLDDASEDLYMLLNLEQASIKVFYEYDDYNDAGTTEDTSDDVIDRVEKSYTLRFSGVTINHVENENSALLAPTSTSDIAIKGGVGNRAIIQLFDEDETSALLDEFRSTEKLINEANLIFYVDPSITENWTDDGLIADRLFLYDIETNTPLVDYFSDPTNDQENGYKFIHGGMLEYKDGKPYRYKFRITEHISTLVRQTEENPVENIALGLVVSSDISNLAFRKAIGLSQDEMDYPYASFTQPLGTVLVGPNPSPENEGLRLRLEIIYTDFSN